MSHTEVKPGNSFRSFNKVTPDAEIEVEQGGLRGKVNASKVGVQPVRGADTYAGPGAETVSFPAGAFTNAPIVVATAVGSAGTENLNVTVYNVTEAGFDYRVTDEAGVEAGADINYIAIAA